MRTALRAAAKGLGRVSPNPCVGAALLFPDGRLLSAYHSLFGEPHAEAKLLSKAGKGKLPRGSILYVTLEPCSHHGKRKTAPCVEAILESRPSRVIVATADPFSRVRGRGLAALAEAGIPVELGVGEVESVLLNLPFHLRHRLGRSLVSLKAAGSLDSRLCTESGASRWITGAPARREVHRERARSDAVVVGSGTVLADDPRLTVRLVKGPQPSRIVIDSRLRTPPRCRLWRAWREEAEGRGVRVVSEPVTEGNFRLAGVRRRDGIEVPRYERAPRLILATADRWGSEHLEPYRRLGWEVWQFPGKRTSLVDLTRQCARAGFLRLMVEAGPGLAGGLLAADLVDEVSLYSAPIILGGGMSWPSGWAAPTIARARRFDRVEAKGLGSDFWFLFRRSGILERARWAPAK